MKEKKKVTSLHERKPYQRLEPLEKRKIVQEIHSGLIGQRAASRKYGINRKTVAACLTDITIVNLKPKEIAQPSISMTESATTKLLARQVQELTKALEHARLKISSLETLIEVSEEELHIKIRKKPGTKQSKE